eukprot:8701898-Pyramimonas_sp.AAC.1
MGGDDGHRSGGGHTSLQGGSRAEGPTGADYLESDGPALEARGGHWIGALGQIPLVRSRTP